MYIQIMICLLNWVTSANICLWKYERWYCLIKTVHPLILLLSFFSSLGLYHGSFQPLYKLFSCKLHLQKNILLLEEYISDELCFLCLTPFSNRFQTLAHRFWPCLMLTFCPTIFWCFSNVLLQMSLKPKRKKDQALWHSYCCNAAV